MERLSALDAEFLLVEDGIAHMHIAGISVFEGSPPALEELTAMVSAKLHLIPRYRQRVRSVPLEMGRPVWVDDPHSVRPAACTRVAPSGTPASSPARPATYCRTASASAPGST